MTRSTKVPAEFGLFPFRASAAISAGLLTANGLRSAAWQRLFYDIYIHMSAYDPNDHQMWCDASHLMLAPGACFGGWSAAFLSGVDILPSTAKVWINLPVNTRVRRCDRVLTRRTPLPRGDVDLTGKVPMTTLARTAFDLGRHLLKTDALIALDSLCGRRLTVEDLRAFAADRWSWPGTKQLRQLLPLIQPMSESPMETRTRLLLIDGKLPTPSAQYEVRAPNGQFMARIDLAYAALKIAIEYEGDHHRERPQFQRDVVRHNALTDAGWLVLRFTADDVLRHPDRLVSQVRNALRDRSQSVPHWNATVVMRTS